MAVAVKTKLKFTEFQVGNLTVGVVRTDADHAASMRALRENGYEPMTTHQQVLTSIDGNEGLKGSLKGTWFHTDIDPRSIGSRDGLRGFTEKGKFTEPGSDIERNVRVWSGSNPVRVFVRSDYYARLSSRRYYLYANLRPGLVAPVVLGIKQVGQPSQAQAGVLEAAQASKQLQTAVQNVARSLGPAEEVVSRIEESGLMRNADFRKLKALVRDAAKLGQIS
ncbi:MAG: hypothetical protein KGH67_00515 [Candidatus Micrarchaeota archaeon]|nr:hypothetical protein [Candidatus Micrarchaeota archaeon]MDE1858994.1 hypothetical protein [Candidatus Micrarchaeota archaeon]